MSASLASFPRLIGVIHLPALPGAPGASKLTPTSALEQAGAQAIAEAKLFEKAGFESVILENFGDLPFLKGPVPPETIAALSVIAGAVIESVRIPVGVNVLRNDAFAALGIASVVGASFIRVNVLSGVAATDQGWVEGQAGELLRKRVALGSNVKIYADAHVKHARTLSTENTSLAIEDLVQRALADAVIVTGSGTGKSVDLSELDRSASTCRALSSPLYVGSGATAESVGELLQFAHGVIVSSALRRGGKAGQPLDPRLLKTFVLAARRKKKPKTVKSKSKKARSSRKK